MSTPKRIRQLANGNLIVPIPIEIEGTDFDAHYDEEIGPDDPRYVDHLRLVEKHGAVGTAKQPDTDWLTDILEHEWDEADEILSHREAMTDLDESGFYADWPLLASWWERIVERDRQEPLAPDQRQRVACVEQTIRRMMPTIVELVGPEMARVDGLDI